jgi:heptosyltransferase-1
MSKTEKSLLLIKASSMGDIVHTFPVLKALKATGRWEKIDWVVNRQFEGLVRLSPYVDGIITFDREKIGSFYYDKEGFTALWRFLGRLRQVRYDMALDLQGLLRSAIISRVARADENAGFASSREGAPFLYRRKVSVDRDRHAIEQYMQISQKLGLIDNSDIGYDLRIDKTDIDKAESLTGSSAYVVINPNARWNSKLWKVKSFAQVALWLYENEGIRSVVTGTKEDGKRAKEIIDITGESVIDLTGCGGFGFLSAVIKKCKFMITNDSGPMHLAVALGKKVIALHGPTDPKLVGPYGKGQFVATAKADCSPCRVRQCDKTPTCMEMISVETVTGLCRELLKG